MIHIGDISREKRLNHPNEALKVGEKVKAQVLEADKERRRLRLGIKQLEPTSIDEYIAEHKAGDTVSGRIVEVSGQSRQSRVGRGCVRALQTAEQKAQEAAASASKADRFRAERDARGEMEIGRRSAEPAAEAPARRTDPQFQDRRASTRRQKKIELEMLKEAEANVARLMSEF